MIMSAAVTHEYIARSRSGPNIDILDLGVYCYINQVYWGSCLYNICMLHIYLPCILKQQGTLCSHREPGVLSTMELFCYI